MSRRKPIRYDPSNDFYVVLGVVPSATMDDIRRSFRLRAKEVHPDRNPDNAEWAHRQFQRLNEAYDVLNDPELRAEYDAKRRLFTRERGPDGTAWWERPHPSAGPRGASATNGGGASAASATANPGTAPFDHAPRTGQTFRRKKRRERPYQTLFVISSLILVGSICASMTRVRVQAPDNADGIANVSSTQMVTSDGPPMCQFPNVSISDPPYRGEVSGRFSIKGTANGPNFVSYRVDIHVYNVSDVTPAPDWISLVPGEQFEPVEDGILVPDNVTAHLPVGDYMIRLTVTQEDGTQLSCLWPIVKIG